MTSRKFEKFYQALENTQVTVDATRTITLEEGVQEASSMVLGVARRGGFVYVVGNGGSASIAGHIHVDLCRACGVRSQVFQDISFVTAVSNDNDYSESFREALQIYAEPGSMLWTVSSSGESENIRKAIEFAKNKGLRVLTLSGFSEHNFSRQQGDLNFYVPSNDYGIVECSHMFIAHTITDQVRDRKKRL